MKADKPKEGSVTPDELAEAWALLQSPIEIGPAATVLRSDGRKLREVKLQPWVKFSVTLRQGMLAKLRGAALSVFVAIALHMDDNNECWPTLATLVKETGWGRTSVSKAIAALEAAGLVQAEERTGTSQVYRIVAGAAFGKGNDPAPVPPIQNLNGYPYAPVNGGSTPRRTGVVHARVRKEEKNHKADIAGENPPAEKVDPVKELAAVFVEVAGIPMPEPSKEKGARDKTTGRLWWMPLKEMVKLANGSSADILRAAVRQLRARQMNVSSPNSCVKTFISLYGAQHGTGSDSPTPAL